MRYRARVFGTGLFMLAGIAVLGGMVMVLWNAVIPSVFLGTRPIDYPHALGLLVLSRVLFGGFRGRGGGFLGGGDWYRYRHRRWWDAMTARERETFRRDAAVNGLKNRGDDI